MNESWKSQLIESRKNSGLSLEEISTKTKIPIKNIIAIEQGSFNDLPAEIFTKSQIQNLSRLLNVDPNMILKEYKNFLKSKIEEDLEDSDKESSSNIINFLDFLTHKLKISSPLRPFSVLILFLLTIFTLYLFFSYEEAEEVINSKEESLISDFETQEDPRSIEINTEQEDRSIFLEESPTIEEASSVIQNNTRKIEIIIDGESWIVVFDKKERLLYELMQTGNYNLEGVSPIIFKVGYAPATKIFIDGKKLNFSKAIKGSTNYAHFKFKDDSTIESIRD